MKIFIVLAVVVLTACAGALEAVENPQGTIQIAYLPITHSLAVMKMNAMQLEDDPYSIELVRFTTWPDVVDALRTGRVDGASVLFEVALQAGNENDGLSLLALSHRDGNVIVVDNNIESYSDLIGRNIAIPHRLSPQNTLLQIVLEREGISLDEVQLIDISPAEMPFSMASGAISAYVVAEPFGTIAESAEVGRILETSNEIFPNSICCVLVFREDAITNEHMLSWFMERFHEAAARVELKDDAVIELFMEHSRLSRSVTEQALANTHFDCLRITEEEYLEVTALILEHGVLETVPVFHDFVHEFVIDRD